MRRIIFLLAIILAVTPLHAREKSDVIVMKNGDKITCECRASVGNGESVRPLR
jgi:hypothetical protein